MDASSRISTSDAAIPFAPAPSGFRLPTTLKIEIEKLSLFYGPFRALHDITMPVYERRITALIGPSGCGKSTLLRCLNRMNDEIRGVRISGHVRLDGYDIRDSDCDVTELRKRVGMVFQRPNPFPLSIADNVLFGLHVAGEKRQRVLSETLEQSLRAAWMWEHVADRLHVSALNLPLDQQQRLCIARVLAVRPEVILLDEPCSALDPIATAKIEELLLELRQRYTIVIVTHNMQQASRISDFAGFLYLGELVEFGPTTEIFTNPRDSRTQAYVGGRFG